MERRTYRVRRIPEYMDRLQVVKLLVALGTGPEQGIKVHSLAPGVDSWERPATKMATVTFDDTPSKFASEASVQWTLPASELGHKQDIVVDVHFLGFTVLNDVRREDHLLDCIAISGLASHPFGSWRCRESSASYMWLRDQLPMDCPSIRSIIYGYETALVMSQSFQTIDDLAVKLIASLKTTGRPASSAKPLIFLAHSLGGVILKRALVLMANSTDADRIILQSIKSIVFFGVPSQGMHVSHLRAMVEGHPNDQLVEDLAYDCLFLKRLEQQFTAAVTLRAIQLVSICETQRSQLPQVWRMNPSFCYEHSRRANKVAKSQLSSSGVWKRTGGHEVLVNRASAVQTGTASNDILPIDRDHSNMVKFAEGEVTYSFILARLNDHCTSLDTVTARPASHLGDTTEESLKPSKVSAKMSNIRTSMMASLFNGNDDSRARGIVEAHNNTFAWVLQEHETGFIEWLRAGRGLYWIQGKPGSGKSTLMKYIQNHSLLKRTEYDNGSGQLIYANFFFHGRGSHLQKSLQGLLQSLLEQILSKIEAFQDFILPLYEKHERERGEQWPVELLMEALTLCFTQSLQKFHICLFLDALDEFDGAKGIIVEFINSTMHRPATSQTRVQICFSSRPWNIFVDYFSHVPGFKIQDYTQEDIRTFALSRIKETPSLKDFLSHGGWFQRIVDKAQGVFLWVALTMNELSISSSDGISIAQLGKLVDGLPEELLGFYDRIIKSIPPQHLAESYIMFEVVLRSREALRPVDVLTALACAPYHTISDCWRQYKDMIPMLDNHENTRRIIFSRCGGLVEIQDNRVQFMHQTVKEFISVPGFQGRLISNHHTATVENGFSFITKMCLTSMFCRVAEVVDFVDGRPIYSYSEEQMGNGVLRLLERGEEEAEEARYCAYMAELTTGSCMEQFYDSFQEHHKILSGPRQKYVEKVYNSYWSILRPSQSIFAVAVLANLQLYVRRKIDHMSPQDLSPLLHCKALLPASGLESMEYDDTGRMIKLLLERGASPEATYNGKTAFHLLFTGSQGIRTYWTPVSKVAEVLLDHGQNPNVDLHVPIFQYERTRNPGFCCKPLHVAHGAMLRSLLARGAEVNALDWAGRTPLDVCMEELSSPTLYELNHTHVKISQLITHGGRITSSGLKHWPQFVSICQKAHPGNEATQFINSIKISELLLPEVSSGVECRKVLQVSGNATSSATGTAKDREPFKKMSTWMKKIGKSKRT